MTESKLEHLGCGCRQRDGEVVLVNTRCTEHYPVRPVQHAARPPHPDTMAGR